MPTGTHRIEVYSIFDKGQPQKVFDKEVEIESGVTATIDVVDAKQGNTKPPLPRARLAVEFVTMAKSYAEKWELPSKSQPQVGVVHLGGGGAKIGLERDDVVLRINGADVYTANQAEVALQKLKTGAPVEFVVVRAAKQLELKGACETGFPEAEEMERLEELAAGDARVRGILGRRYALGVGVAKDDAEAVKWFRKAAEAGDAYGQESLGFCYLIGQGLPKNEEEALQWFRKAADQEWASAQHILGDLYQFGPGVKKDLKEAVKWYKKAADQDNAAAQNNLGWMNEKGIGMPKNDAAAVKWYKQAVLRDHPFAQHNLAAMYEGARGGLGRDFPEALRLYRLAADQGEPRSKERLGLLGK
jgi:TPR repeat protein